MAIIDLSDLDLNKKADRDQAKQRLTVCGKKNLIDATHQANDTPLGNDEEVPDRIETIGDLIDEIDFFEKALERSRPHITAWDDIEVTEREWLIPQWLPANTVTMFTGEGGAGKSWLTLQVICQVACGFRDAYLNPKFAKTADVEQRRHVVFATYEDEPAEIKRRLQALASGMRWINESLNTIQQHVHIVDMRGIGSVWGPGIGKHIANTGDLLSAGEDLRAICEEKNARLLVMDPLSGAFGGNENDRTAVYDFVSSFRGWGDAVGCAMLVIGHLPKSAEGKAAGFSGSTAWEASARSMWMLDRQSFEENSTDNDNNKQTRYYWALSHTKSNYAPLQPLIPLIKTGTGWWMQATTCEDAAEGYEAYQAGIEYQITNGEGTNDEDYQIV